MFLCSCSGRLLKQVKVLLTLLSPPMMCWSMFEQVKNAFLLSSVEVLLIPSFISFFVTQSFRCRLMLICWIFLEHQWKGELSVNFSKTNSLHNFFKTTEKKLFYVIGTEMNRCSKFLRLLIRFVSKAMIIVLLKSCCNFYVSKFKFL